MNWVPLGKDQAMGACITEGSTMVWVHDREIGVVRMEIRPLDPDKGVQGTRQIGKYSGKIFKGAVWV